MATHIRPNTVRVDLLVFGAVSHCHFIAGFVRKEALAVLIILDLKPSIYIIAGLESPVESIVASLTPGKGGVRPITREARATIETLEEHLLGLHIRVV